MIEDGVPAGPACRRCGRPSGGGLCAACRVKGAIQATTPRAPDPRKVDARPDPRRARPR